ncbi:hypothetical protein GGQ99_002356 [Aminobacter niigataensis]|uniref:Uncharacterized protein n=1 Tax=Aminobacter niigataensis TaxID=83265 RepID=A0ABR6L1V4_9HYPH|nr:hypothetical protein [Aminobacter niigataensis]
MRHIRGEEEAGSVLLPSHFFMNVRILEYVLSEMREAHVSTTIGRLHSVSNAFQWKQRWLRA